MEQTKLFHDFPRLAEESGFHLNYRTKRFDWAKLRAIDVDDIAENNKIGVLEKSLELVLAWDMDGDLAKVLDKNVVKLFRLAQLGISYLTHCQTHLDRVAAILRQQLTASMQECKRLKQEYIEESKRFKCDLCDKMFRSNHYLESHQRRRHLNSQASRISVSLQTDPELRKSMQTVKLQTDVVSVVSQSTQTCSTQTMDVAVMTDGLTEMIDNNSTMEDKLGELLDRIENHFFTPGLSNEQPQPILNATFLVPSQTAPDAPIALSKSPFTPSRALEFPPTKPASTPTLPENSTYSVIPSKQNPINLKQDSDTQLLIDFNSTSTPQFLKTADNSQPSEPVKSQSSIEHQVVEKNSWDASAFLLTSTPDESQPGAMAKPVLKRMVKEDDDKLETIELGLEPAVRSTSTVSAYENPIPNARMKLNFSSKNENSASFQDKDAGRVKHQVATPMQMPNLVFEETPPIAAPRSAFLNLDSSDDESQQELTPANIEEDEVFKIEKNYDSRRQTIGNIEVEEVFKIEETNDGQRQTIGNIDAFVPKKKDESLLHKVTGRIGKRLRSSWHNLTDNLSLPLKSSTDNKETTAVEIELLDNRLVELGVPADSLGLTEESFNAKISLLKTRRENLCRSVPGFLEIREQVVEGLNRVTQGKLIDRQASLMQSTDNQYSRKKSPTTAVEDISAFEEISPGFENFKDAALDKKSAEPVTTPQPTIMYDFESEPESEASQPSVKSHASKPNNANVLLKTPASDTITTTFNSTSTPKLSAHQSSLVSPATSTTSNMVRNQNQARNETRKSETDLSIFEAGRRDGNISDSSHDELPKAPIPHKSSLSKKKDDVKKKVVFADNFEVEAASVVFDIGSESSDSNISDWDIPSPYGSDGLATQKVWQTAACSKELLIKRLTQAMEASYRKRTHEKRKTCKLESKTGVVQHAKALYEL